ncbi:putative L-lactate dehydrogenase operon regulatory protein [Hartmannibacter diazotrophicus]|uniref:Putative L-lactate dehydrogenase operon regulatory protein n=1 Tax=Hartmannibacter diazotrophicus TaxID=1482074 RepID=A0A2C9DE65_9HYPH|nr:FCD domain-containing protein [Hartmannibacter diazotrophicus]SON58101.1 putative L-lactate dehydrogenase operon regulatory protein [Hartmannibacter diazotrophicus]
MIDVEDLRDQTLPVPERPEASLTAMPKEPAQAQNRRHPALGTRRRKRPDLLADQIRGQIADNGLKPGDRLPPDWLKPELRGVARGTLREALKVLEFQGLVTTRTGPGGGVFVSEVSADQALQVIDNLFLFRPPSIADIQHLRRVVEPELAASLAGRLSEEDFLVLRDKIGLLEAEPATPEDEERQRRAELDFHIELARRAPNALVGFMTLLLLSLLRDRADFQDVPDSPARMAADSGLDHRIRLIRALHSGEAGRSRAAMEALLENADRFGHEAASHRRD